MCRVHQTYCAEHDASRLKTEPRKGCVFPERMALKRAKALELVARNLGERVKAKLKGALVK